MATTTNPKASMQVHSAGRILEDIGHGVIRYGLVVVLLWIGALKFTAYEAEGIKPLVSNSPFMSWGYQVMSVQGFSMLIGIIEIAIGLLIATRCCAPMLSALGSLLAFGMFLITATFAFTTPGVWQEGYGFPFLSPMPGQFLAKDLLFLGGGDLVGGRGAEGGEWRSIGFLVGRIQ